MLSLVLKNKKYFSLLGLSFLLLTISLIVFKLGCHWFSGMFAIPAFSLLAISTRYTKDFKSLAFTCWVLASVTACMYYPNIFIKWGSFELKVLIVPLIQLIMFGMGTTLCIDDFKRVLKMPQAFLIGMLLQFTVMPFVAALLVKIFGFDPMIAVGVILIGTCPGGVASNVMTYIARGNVALSVTMTACSTIVSPLMTPLMMKLLANQYTHIDFWAMMIGIVNMIIFPVVAGLIANKLLHRLSKWRDRILPLFSMCCLCLIISIITALSRDSFLSLGVAIFSAAVILNAIGYIMGYFSAKLVKLDEVSCRTVAIEVGLQNGGMATGIAMNILNSAQAGLAPAIFGVWQNISGSLLASFWRRKSSKSEIKQAICADEYIEYPSDVIDDLSL